MNTRMSEVASARIAQTPTPERRYGLGVVLRKPYPRPSGERGTGNSEQGILLALHGADLSTISWDDLPEELLKLVRWRTEDPLVAAHILQSASIKRVHVRGEQTLRIPDLSRLLGHGTLLIEVEADARLHVVERDPIESAVSNYSTSKDTLSSAMLLLRVGSGAHVVWRSAAMDQRGGSISEYFVLLQREASLDVTATWIAPELMRSSARIFLCGEGATARVNGLIVGASDHQADVDIAIEHSAPRTTSDLRVRCVLGGKAQAVIRGLVRVQPGAVRSDGYQRFDSLLLSPTAEVDPVPNLEIQTNDVRCTHAVTTSHLNEEQLFYLRARGLSEAVAQDLLVEGFTGTMLRSYDKERRVALATAIRETLNA